MANTWPNLIEPARVGRAHRIRIVAALHDADGKEHERLERRELLARYQDHIRVVVGVAEADAWIRFHDRISNSQQHLLAPGVELNGGVEPLHPGLDARHHPVGIGAQRGDQMEGVECERAGCHEKKAKTNQGDRLPAGSRLLGPLPRTLLGFLSPRCRRLLDGLSLCDTENLTLRFGPSCHPEPPDSGFGRIQCLSWKLSRPLSRGPRQHKLRTG